MKLFVAATTVLSMALLATTVAPNAKADEWNEKTKLTFSGPVEIPGVHLQGWGILPAGTYVFKLLDSQSDRNIVQIFNADETKVIATILAINNYRLKTTDRSVITFRERPAGEPEALRAWFYPGRNYGQEFVYPKSRAIVLAKETNTPVLFVAVEIPAEVATPIETVDHPVVVQLKQAPVMAVQPTGETVEVAAVVTPVPVPAAVPEPTPAPVQVAAATLPATASYLPLIGLIGLLALAGAFVVRSVATRIR